MTRIGLAAAAFSVGALAWAAAIPLAAVVVASTSGMAVPKVAASAVYVAGAVVCHQKPERSFHLAGQPLPVCARCTGIYAGAALAVLGMAAFATGLALPFFFLALFPGYLKKLPRSGGWMARVKVVLGFIVLAVMFKYLSNIDQVFQAHWLSRERFLAIWIVLFAMAGLYLLGFVKLESMTKDEPLGVGRALTAAAFLAFAISLTPGLFGARLGELDAYIPEPSDNFLSAAGNVSAQPANYFKDDLDGALTAAREQNKLVLINFTGYACTNCHWMKANMFPRPKIQTALKNLIVVDLYTDGTDAASKKNADLEDKKFNTASIPFYAIIDTNQNIIATFPQLTRNTQEFLAFLETRPTGRA